MYKICLFLFFGYFTFCRNGHAIAQLTLEEIKRENRTEKKRKQKRHAKNLTQTKVKCEPPQWKTHVKCSGAYRRNQGF